MKRSKLREKKVPSANAVRPRKVTSCAAAPCAATSATAAAHAAAVFIRHSSPRRGRNLFEITTKRARLASVSWPEMEYRPVGSVSPSAPWCRGDHEKELK